MSHIIPSPSPATIANGAPSATSDLALTLRGMHQPAGQGRRIRGSTVLRALRTALAVTDYNAAEPVIEWRGTDHLAVLDIDYHDLPLDRRPNAEQLVAIARQICPQPRLWWISHGRGLHLVYVAQDGYPADELAAVAALSAKRLSPICSVEIKSQTRHPGYSRPGHPAAGKVVRLRSALDLSELLRLLGCQAPDEESIEEYLRQNGLAREHSYSHDRCPCDPETESHGEPVFVGNGLLTRICG